MDKMDKNQVTRRTFVKQSASIALGSASILSGIPLSILNENPAVFQAIGTRVGEVTENSALVWTRLTANKERNNGGIEIKGRAQDYKGKGLPKVTVPVEQLEGACGGKTGFARLRYATNEKMTHAQTTDWVKVSEKTDFIHQFYLSGLKPSTKYYYICESAIQTNKQISTSWRGQFETAPTAQAASNLRFCLMTCQGYPDRGHKDGHDIYPSMLALKPQFACLTGDLVYYDNDMPRAVNERLARYHWERMFSLPRLKAFNSNVATYWLKDDHDTLDNDSSPGGTMGELTFAQGQKIFHQQAPMTTGASYRTFRWGKDLQIWLTEGRDERSPNDMPDGPEKTIWGKTQKGWFKKTVKESDATWKILISPTPLVGPDRVQKDDNHSNAGFQHEGDELRQWIHDNVPENFFVICGDRHWQYHSVHPKTGVHEFSIGAASDEHAGGTPGENKAYHRFHLVKGGFISVELRRESDKSVILLQHHDVHGAVVYKWQKERLV